MRETETEAEAEPGQPRRRRGGPIPKPAAERRSRLIAINLNVEEWEDLQRLADAAELPVRRFMRIRALGYRIPRRRSADRVSPAAFDAAAILASLARELADMAEAGTADPLARPSPQALAQLAERAHAAGLRLFGAAPDAA